MTADREDAHDVDRPLVGGRESRPIVIHDPDPAWAARYREEYERVASALGPLALRIEHIGSTSVQGLGAKPIVDVLVAVADVTTVDVADVRRRLAAAGYELRVDEPGHRMFRTADRGVHLHVWPEPGDDVRRHLLFRDYLRASAPDRTRYEAVKRELATREWGDMNDYADAKSPVIGDITARAEAWARRTAWAPSADGAEST